MSGSDEVEDMDTSDTPFNWYYLADCGRWHQFEDDFVNRFSSKELERYYLKNSRGVLTNNSCGGVCKVDFSEMKLISPTKREHILRRGLNIIRSCSCFQTGPVFWEEVDLSRPYQLIPLREQTPEYQTVAGYVKNEGLLDRTVESISRIQNVDLWEMYCRKRKQLMRIHGVEDIEERRLFHGTHKDNIEAICKYNFDLRLAGQHGSTYGKGIYFAKHASHSDKYSRGSGGTHRTMILARVIVGKSTVGRSNYQKPDHGSLENDHDSCVDKIADPNIFVIFDANQIYPEYLIQYR